MLLLLFLTCLLHQVAEGESTTPRHPGAVTVGAVGDLLDHSFYWKDETEAQGK
jgi:hypothetical protein